MLERHKEVSIQTKRSVADTIGRENSKQRGGTLCR